MIGPDYVRTMAAYNAWQNRSLYAAAATLADDARRAARGAFWGSIHGTLSHLVWGDQIWMSRFDGWEKPARPIGDSAAEGEDFAAMHDRRVRMDAAIADWAGRVDAAWLAEDLRWFSALANRWSVMPCWLLVTHFFNHQTHHRGQAHAMLTAAGACPEATDLPWMPGPG